MDNGGDFRSSGKPSPIQIFEVGGYGIYMEIYDILWVIWWICLDQPYDFWVSWVCLRWFCYFPKGTPTLRGIYEGFQFVLVFLSKSKVCLKNDFLVGCMTQLLAMKPKFGDLKSHEKTFNDPPWRHWELDWGNQVGKWFNLIYIQICDLWNPLPILIHSRYTQFSCICVSIHVTESFLVSVKCRIYAICTYSYRWYQQ